MVMPRSRFEFHQIEDLVAHFACGESVRVLQEPIAQCAFPVVDVPEDAEVSDVFQLLL